MLVLHNETKALSLSPLDGMEPQDPREDLPEQSGTIWQVIFLTAALHVRCLALFY